MVTLILIFIGLFILADVIAHLAKPVFLLGIILSGLWVPIVVAIFVIDLIYNAWLFVTRERSPKAKNRRPPRQKRREPEKKVRAYQPGGGTWRTQRYSRARELRRELPTHDLITERIIPPKKPRKQQDPRTRKLNQVRKTWENQGHRVGLYDESTGEVFFAGDK